MEPPQLPKGPHGTNARGDAPSQKRNAHQRRKPSGKTRCKRGDNATGANNETDAKKRWRARSGHSQRVSAKPTAEAYKATTKKEPGEGMSERLRHGLQQRNKRKKKLQTPEGEKPSREGRTLADSQPQGGNSKRTGSPRVPGEPTVRGGSHTRRRRLQA